MLQNRSIKYLYDYFGVNYYLGRKIFCKNCILCRNKEHTCMCIYADCQSNKAFIVELNDHFT